MQLAAHKLGITLPEDVAIEADVSLGKTAGGAHYALAARLNISLPGLDDAQKRQLVEAAHDTCPYSRATRGNIDVELAVA